jgi:hypothetical protein
MPGTYTTKDDRAWRAGRLIIPIKMRVRQTDGSYQTQRVEVSVKADKRISRKSRKNLRRGK